MVTLYLVFGKIDFLPKQVVLNFLSIKIMNQNKNVIIFLLTKPKQLGENLFEICGKNPLEKYESVVKLNMYNMWVYIEIIHSLAARQMKQIENYMTETLLLRIKHVINRAF